MKGDTLALMDEKEDARISWAGSFRRRGHGLGAMDIQLIPLGKQAERFCFLILEQAVFEIIGGMVICSRI